MPAPKKNEKERRKRSRESVLLLLRRVKTVCGAVGRADDIADQIEDVVKRVTDFINGADAKDLIREDVRRQVQIAGERFSAAKDNLDTIAIACDRLTKALSAAEKVLSTGVSLTVVLAGAAVLAGAVVIAAVAVSDEDGDDSREPDRGRTPTVTHLGVTDPEDVSSLSHEIGVPSANPIVIVNWSFHEGALAFSIEWAQGSSDMPDTQPDLPGGATGATSPELVDGSWYFHLRTQGEDGGWTSTVHLGPFVIDRLAGCPELTDVFLQAIPLNGNETDLSWKSAGGCAPFEGEITATYSGEDAPYAAYELGEASGSVRDVPPPRCEGTFEVVFVLTQTDARGQVARARAARSSVVWVC